MDLYDDHTISYKSKNSPSSNKRNRRRPHQTEKDDEDDESEGMGFDSFFRMMLYPVEMLMEKISNSFGGEPEEEVAQTKVSTEKGNSLGSWIGSWFGINRQTKKIGNSMETGSKPVETGYEYDDEEDDECKSTNCFL